MQKQAQAPSWKFSDDILNHVVGKTDEEIREKQNLIRKRFLGKELKRFYSPKRDGYVYRIGHTNHIISEVEFQDFVNNGLVIPTYKGITETTLENTKRVFRKIVKSPADTGEMPIAEPDYRHVPESTKEDIEAARTAAFKADGEEPHSTTSLVEAVPTQSMEAEAAATQRVLAQTGMMQALEESTFFDNYQNSGFSSFEEAAQQDSVINKMKGLFGNIREAVNKLGSQADNGETA